MAYQNPKTSLLLTVSVGTEISWEMHTFKLILFSWILNKVPNFNIEFGALHVHSDLVESTTSSQPID